MPPLQQVSVTFKKAPKAKAEIVARLRNLWDDSTESTADDGADDFDELDEAEG